MTGSIILRDREICYELRRSRRARRITLAVYCDASVVVTMPAGATLDAARDFIREKIGWLIDKIDRLHDDRRSVPLPGGRTEYLKNRNAVLELARARVSHFNRFYDCQVGNIAVKAQKTRWGSCSRKGNLNFNYKILFLPAPLRDYIIVHELCHLREFNHSPRFWSLVEKTVPDYKAIAGQIRNIPLY